MTKKMNSPSIKERIREYLLQHPSGSISRDIVDYVLPKITLLGKTPRDTIRSVLYTMPDVKRTDSGKYKLVR
jgi:hypothetical protein